MLVTKLKLLVAAGMAAAVFGTAGLGLVAVPAGDGPPAAGAKAAPPKPPEPPTAAPDKPAENPGPPKLQDEQGVRSALTLPMTDLPPSLRLRELFDDLHTRYGINARLDLAEFKRLGNGTYGGMAAAPPALDDKGSAFVAAAVPADEQVVAALELYDAQIRFPVTRGLTVGDVLSEAVAQLPGKCRYRVRGNQVLVGPAFLPAVVPGRNGEEGGPIIPNDRLIEQILGEPVSVALDGVSLIDAIKELRRLTGANIVLDARCKEQAKDLVTGTFDDTRLLTVLTVLADQCDLKPVAMNNVYYVTAPDNAAKFQKGIDRELFGEPDPPAPAAGPVGGKK